MPLKIIGSGFGRTGTLTLKTALEQLGFGPCHHMEEVLHDPAQVPYWQAIAAGRPVVWDDVFRNYNAQVDWPGAHVWRELAAAYPDARVIHSVRPEDAWWNSFSRTIGKLMSIHGELPMPPHVAAMMEAAMTMIGQQTFGGRFTDRESAIATYRRRTEEVRAAIAPERLLVFDVAEGWGPLCRFLGAPEPATPFPRTNSTQDFWAQVGGEPA